MMPHLDRPRIKTALAVLSVISPEMQLLALKKMCQADGIWTIPEDGSRYNPVLYEISLHGVPAIANDPNDLARNWIRAARNVLKGQPEPYEVAT